MIEVSNITKSFDGKIVLDNISLRIPEGAKMCIVGKSGSGKSVLARIILGLLDADEGEVIIDNKSTKDFRQSDWNQLLNNFGVVFQGAALFDSLTILENVGLKLYEERKFDAGEVRDKVIKSLARVDLGEEILYKYPAELSGGMRKRVGISRAIINRPKYLIYDEPSTGLDPLNSNVIDALINDIALDEGTTSLIITHDMFTVRQVATHVAMIHNSSLLYEGDLDGFMRSDIDEIRSFLARSLTADGRRFMDDEPGADTIT